MIRIDDRLYDESYFSETSARLAAEIGLSDRDTGRYAVCFPETVDWLALFFAIRKAGASVLPIHPGTPYPGARKLAIGAGCDRLLYNSLTAEVLQKPELGSPQGTLLQMSSGTTGAPKCVARSWAEIDAEIESYVRTFRQPEGMTPVIACPTTHSYGLICGILVALKRGQTPVIVNTGNPKYLLKVLRETERPLLYSSPAILHTLARLLPQGEQIHATMTSGTLLPIRGLPISAPKAGSCSSNMAAPNPAASPSIRMSPPLATWASCCRIFPRKRAAVSKTPERLSSGMALARRSTRVISATAAPTACWSSSPVWTT